MKKKLITLILTLFTFVLVQAMPPHPDVVKKHIDKGSLSDLNKVMAVKQKKGKNAGKRSFPTTGDREVLVILIQYGGASPTSMDAQSTPAFYEELFNGGGSTSLTWKKYYQDMSNNQLNLNFTVVGPYTADQELSFYGENDSNGDDKYPGMLVEEAIDEANTTGNLDFDLYDNGTGEINIMVIHAGRGEESGAAANTIWSHRSKLEYAKDDSGNTIGAQTVDGVTINDYAIMPEYIFSPGDSTIGVFCHEFGHILGLPDLYDTNEFSSGVGDWSLMSRGSWGGNNGDVPSPLLAWERADLGWIELTEARVPEKPADPINDPFNSQKFNRNNKLKYASLGGIIGFIFLLGIFITTLFSKKRRISNLIKTSLVLLVLSGLLIIASCVPLISEDFKGMMYSLKDINESHKAIKFSLDYKYDGGKQYCIVENIVKKDGTWTQYLPGEGLLVTRVDDYLLYKVSINNGTYTGAREANAVNAFAYLDAPFGVGIVEADGDDALYDGQDNGDKKDCFYKGNTESINLQYFDWENSNNTDSDIILSGFSKKDDKMTFYLMKE